MRDLIVGIWEDGETILEWQLERIVGADDEKIWKGSMAGVTYCNGNNLLMNCVEQFHN